MSSPFDTHIVYQSCNGERCQMCYEPATHKVGEEIPHRDRHNFTAYVCCRCFGAIFGVVAINWCETGEMIPTLPTAPKGE